MLTPVRHAAFNAWANERLHAACSMLDESRLQADRRAYFGSILGTLNHILLVDILYMDRLRGRPSVFRRLDETVCPTFSGLRTRQAEQDRLYAEYAAALTPADLAGVVRFQTLLAEPKIWTVPLDTYLANLFQHQAHHRGQAHTLLSQEGIDPPPIGYVEYAIEAGLVPPPRDPKEAS